MQSSKSNIQVTDEPFYKSEMPANDVGALTNDGAGNLSWASAGGAGWGLSGNTLSGSEFLGTTGNQDFIIKTNSIERGKFYGNGDGFNVSGDYFLGGSRFASLAGNGMQVGYLVGRSGTAVGDENTVFGINCLRGGGLSTATLQNVIFGNNMLAAGGAGGSSNEYNVLVGGYGLTQAFGGNLRNTVMGFGCVNNPSFGGDNLTDNALFGFQAGHSLDNFQANNSFFGSDCFKMLHFGDNNIGLGKDSGKRVTTGSNNIFIGSDPNTMTSSSNNTFIGMGTTTIGNTTDTLKIGAGGVLKLGIDDDGIFELNITTPTSAPAKTGNFTTPVIIGGVQYYMVLSTTP